MHKNTRQGKSNEKTLMHCIMGYAVSGVLFLYSDCVTLCIKLLQPSVEFNFPSVLLNSSVFFFVVFFFSLGWKWHHDGCRSLRSPCEEKLWCGLLEAGSVIQTDYRKQLTGIMGKRRQRQLHLPCWPRVSNLHDFLFTSRGRGLLLGSVNEKLLITFFHSGLDQRKQTGGVIVALLKIRTKKKRALGIISVFFFFFHGPFP